jgi:hypothetical protein
VVVVDADPGPHSSMPSPSVLELEQLRVAAGHGKVVLVTHSVPKGTGSPGPRDREGFPYRPDGNGEDDVVSVRRALARGTGLGLTRRTRRVGSGGKSFGDGHRDDGFSYWSSDAVTATHFSRRVLSSVPMSRFLILSRRTSWSMSLSTRRVLTKSRSFSR